MTTISPHRPLAIVLLALLPLSIGCGTSAVPSTMPSSIPQAFGSAATPQSTDVSGIFGFVLDTGYRPVAGARIEVLDGPSAGTTITADATGEFTMPGTFDSATRFRATKNGYVTATQTWSCSVGVCPGPGNAKPWLGFYLAVFAPPLNLAGDYTLTLTVDRACADFPDQLRTRSYAATIAPAPTANTPADTRFQLTVSGGPFLTYAGGESYNSFPIGVAGDYVSFFLYGGHNPAIAERLAPNTSIAFSGNASAPSVTSTASSITASLDGWIEYCVMPSEMGHFYNCGRSNVTGEPIAGAAVTRSTCESPHHQLVLTRR